MGPELGRGRTDTAKVCDSLGDLATSRVYLLKLQARLRARSSTTEKALSKHS